MSWYGITIQCFLLFLAALVVAQNPLVSDGTCYYAAGKQSNQGYIPCGNSAFGAYSCCLNGDVCLSSNACYNAKYGDTYLAGCTDSSYKDPTCAYKGIYGSNQWVSLVRCFVSNDTTSNKEQWAPCNEPSQPLVSKPSGGCVCNAAASTAVFTDNPSLTAVAVLPANTGQSISFAAGHYPATNLKPTSSSISSSSITSISSATSSATSSFSSSSSRSTSGSTSTSSSATSTSTSTSTNTGTATGAGAASITASTTSSSTSPSATSSTGGLSVGAEAGIGAGIGLGVLALCALLFLLYRRHRNKKEKQQADQRYSAVPHASPYTDDKVPWSTPTTYQTTPRPNMRSPEWSGHKPELPGEGSSVLPSIRASVLMPAGMPTTHELPSHATENKEFMMSQTPTRPDNSLRNSASQTWRNSGTAGGSRWDDQETTLINTWNSPSHGQPGQGSGLPNRTIHELSG